MSRNLIVVSWVARNNDPFKRSESGDRYVLDQRGAKQRGPSLELLTNEQSPYRGKVRRAYFFVQRGHTEKQFEELRAELKTEDPDIRLEPRYWDTKTSPTNHDEILEFTGRELRSIRSQHPDAKLVINISPGTPQMQTVLLLALQAGLAAKPIEAVQGIPPQHRRDGRVVEEVPVDLIGRLNRRWSELTLPQEPAGLWTLQQARSPALQTVAAQVDQYGPMPFPVLVLGPRGSGKSTVAYELRRRFFTARGAAVPEKRLVRANCATFVDDTHAKSELFGHEKGAFTGADKDRQGLLEQGANDCVFLDEVHHLSLSVQAMLLQATEHRGAFRRLGSETEVDARFRLICASNRSESALRKMLYEDFYDRIETCVIELPPLRDCRLDLASIWERVVIEVATDFVHRVGDGAASREQLAGGILEHRAEIDVALAQHPLSANWRDLQRLARRLLAKGLQGRLASTFGLSRNDVEDELAAFSALRGGAPASSEDELLEQLSSLGHCVEAAKAAVQAGAELKLELLTDAWTERLLRAATHVTRSQKEAAKLLGVPERTLSGKLSKLQGKNGA